MKKIKMICVVSLILILSIGSKGCALLENDLSELKSAF